MLKQRIQILKMGGVIGEDVAEFMNKVIDMMAADYPQVGMDPAAMFTTHLAMALERIKKGEVVEALPGASKLVPGLTVWDVAEVAPGKFRVERASSPSQSAPLTLTAPGGRVAELTVGDDLVLEVKEI